MKFEIDNIRSRLKFYLLIIVLLYLIAFSINSLNILSTMINNKGTGTILFVLNFIVYAFISNKLISNKFVVNILIAFVTLLLVITINGVITNPNIIPGRNATVNPIPTILCFGIITIVFWEILFQIKLRLKKENLN